MILDPLSTMSMSQTLRARFVLPPMLSSSSARVLAPRLHAWAGEEDFAGANWATCEDSECIYPCEDLVQKGAGLLFLGFLNRKSRRGQLTSIMAMSASQAPHAAVTINIK